MRKGEKTPGDQPTAATESHTGPAGSDQGQGQLLPCTSLCLILGECDSYN